MPCVGHACRARGRLLQSRPRGAQPQLALVAALRLFGLPTGLPRDLPRSAVIEALERDKKFEEGQVRFVLLRRLGDAYVSAAVPLAAIEDAVLTLYGP